MDAGDELVAEKFALILSAAFPDRKTFDESLVETWIGELYDAYAKEPNVDEITEGIVRLAVRKWKSPPEGEPDSVEVNSKSVSLWNQLQGFSPRVFWPDIENVEASPAARLVLLQKVDHVDDVSSDWAEVQKLLQGGLEEPDLTVDYTELHVKWFDQCSSAAEFQTLQVDLCRNLLHYLQRHFSKNFHCAESSSIGFSTHQNAVFHVLQRWDQMWAALLSKHFIPEESLNEMVFEILIMMKSMRVPNEQPAGMGLFPSHFLAILDPYSSWFHRWVRRIAAPTAACVIRASEIVPHLWLRCESSGSMGNLYVERDETELVTTRDIPEGDTLTTDVLNQAIHVQSIAMLCQIMEEMRDFYFPWDHLSREAHPIGLSDLVRRTLPRFEPDEAQRSTAQPGQLLAFLKTISIFTAHREAMSGLSNCHARAVEAILFGPCETEEYKELVVAAVTQLRNPHRHLRSLLHVFDQWRRYKPDLVASRFAEELDVVNKAKQWFSEIK